MNSCLGKAMLRSGISLLLLSALLGAFSVADVYGDPFDTAGFLERLGNDEYEVWRGAQTELANRGVEGVEIATQLYLEGRIHESSLGSVLDLVQTAEARQTVAALLTHESIVIRFHAANALADMKDEGTVVGLQHGIRLLIEEHRSGLTTDEGHREREARSSATYWMPRALWGVKPTKESADIIIELADLHEEEKRFDILAALNDNVGRTFWDAETSLKVLFHAMGYMGGPEGMDVRLDNAPGGDFPLFDDAFQREFVLAHREEAVALMREEFAKSNSNLSVLMLGFLKDETSVPAMAKLYLTAGGFYGWESSTPDIFGGNQYITHTVVEEAIEHITGESIEDVITLSEKDIEVLKARADEGERAALYILHRWRPEIAKALLSRYQRDKTVLSSEAGYALMQHYVKDGMTMSEVREMLGEPDRVFGSQWYYRFEIGGVAIGRLLFHTGTSEKGNVEDGVLIGMSLSGMQADEPEL